MTANIHEGDAILTMYSHLDSNRGRSNPITEAQINKKSHFSIETEAP